jgi:hypothetical protein
MLEKFFKSSVPIKSWTEPVIRACLYIKSQRKIKKPWQSVTVTDLNKSSDMAEYSALNSPTHYRLYLRRLHAVV